MGSRRSNLYLWLHLDPATNYTFTVSACHGLTKDCGPASSAVSASTLDGEAGPPADVVARCSHDNVSGMNFVDVSWREPTKKYGVVELFNVSRRNCESIYKSFKMCFMNRFISAARLPTWIRMARRKPKSSGRR